MSRDDLVSEIAQILEPWAWETKSYNATVARDDATSKAMQIIELLAKRPADDGEALNNGLRARVKEVVEENGDGFWRTCTGCYESEDGYPVGEYPHSEALGCTLGGGCSECGGLGATWDNADYSTMVDDMLADDALEQQAQAGGKAAEAAAVQYLANLGWLPDYVQQFVASLTATTPAAEGEGV